MLVKVKVKVVLRFKGLCCNQPLWGQLSSISVQLLYGSSSQKLMMFWLEQLPTPVSNPSNKACHDINFLLYIVEVDFQHYDLIGIGQYPHLWKKGSK